jgi:phosphoribosylaminoimidazolecarboxamide formyltransferase / IMP cyclohydrolase
LIKRALISVFDKEGIEEFARELIDLNIEIISTGGTYNLLRQSGINVTSVDEVTGFPEILSGRVKTLHPKIFGAILADRSNESHNEEMKEHQLQPIGLVVVNLYPFQNTIAKSGVTFDEAIEQIDIGGVTLIRAAAKNCRNVSVVTSKDQYEEFIAELKRNEKSIPFEYSKKLAAKAFDITSSYDKSIQKYFSFDDKSESKFAGELEAFSNYKKQQLRYGENPHQSAYLLKENFDEIFNVLHGKELSYNNILDIDAAYNLISEFKDDDPACAIIKHGNPSGVAVSENLTDAYTDAFNTDTISPFGGIIIFNKKLDFKTSIEVDKLFTEIILAPGFDEKSLELLKKKKNRRLISFIFTEGKTEFRKITGGVLYQEKDNFSTGKENLKVVTEKSPDKKEIEDLIFAFKVVKHTKSNAVIFVKNKKTLAIGGGQPSRIDSTKIAVMKASKFNLDLNGSIAASDAFFPFPDGLIEIAEAGATAVIQPGGSVRDDEVIRAANERKIAMVFTGIRHFKH